MTVNPSIDPKGAARHGLEKTTTICTLTHGLMMAVSDTYDLLFKSHMVYLRLDGASYRALHRLTEAHYDNLYAAGQRLVTRLRNLGSLAPAQLAQIIQTACVSDAVPSKPQATLLRELVMGHETAAARMRMIIPHARDKQDEATSNLLARRAAFHDRAASLLRVAAA